MHMGCASIAKFGTEHVNLIITSILNKNKIDQYTFLWRRVQISMEKVTAVGLINHNLYFNVFFSGICPSSRLESTQENLNALLKYSLAHLEAVNGSTKVKGLDTNRDSLWTSVCEILPTIPATFYCSAHGQNTKFQANYTTQSLISSGFPLRPHPNRIVSVPNTKRSDDR